MTPSTATSMLPLNSASCTSAPNGPGDGLYEAIQANDFDKAKSLVALGIAHDPVSFVALMENCLHFAAWKRKLEFIDLLVDSGASIENKSAEGRTPLFDTFFEDRIDAFRHLVKKGASLQAMDGQGDGLLHDAIHFNAPQCTLALLEMGADLAQKGRLDVSALECAKDSRIWPAVQSYLLRKEARTALGGIKLSKKHGLTP